LSDIFLSYAREERSRALELVRVFQGRQWSTFWDRDISPGKSFDTVIENELAAARCVVVLWSRDAVGSAWVRGEAHKALERDILVPVLLANVTPPVPFNAMECLVLHDWPMKACAAEMERLLAAIQRTLSGGPVAASYPFADDPSLSTRVAQRVLDAMSRSDDDVKGRIIDFERLIADTALALLEDDASATVEALLERVALTLGAGALLLVQDGRPVFGLGAHASLDSLAAPGQDNMVHNTAAGFMVRLGTTGNRSTLALSGDKPLPEEIEARLPALARLLGQLDNEGS